jgi:hypothetical protein
MLPQLSPEQQAVLHSAEPETVIELVDPQTDTVYVLLRAEVYERCRSVLDQSEGVDIRAAYPLMDAVARSAGWDDPAEDIYSDLDPRQAK